MDANPNLNQRPIKDLERELAKTSVISVEFKNTIITHALLIAEDSWNRGIDEGRRRQKAANIVSEKCGDHE